MHILSVVIVLTSYYNCPTDLIQSAHLAKDKCQSALLLDEYPMKLETPTKIWDSLIRGI